MGLLTGKQGRGPENYRFSSGLKGFKTRLLSRTQLGEEKASQNNQEEEGSARLGSLRDGTARNSWDAPGGFYCRESDRVTGREITSSPSIKKKEIRCRERIQLKKKKER